MSRDLQKLGAPLPLPGGPSSEASLARHAALDFADQTVREAQRSRRAAWIIVGALILVVAAQAAAIAIMLPLKEVQPYTILVDRQTGYLELARGVSPGALAEDEAVVTALAAQYVLQRETFDTLDLEERYARVALWSAAQARSDYVDAHRAAGPGSVLAGKRPETRVRVVVTKVALGQKGKAEVWFETTTTNPDETPVVAQWQAVLAYRFTGAPLRMKDRLVNPLGFQVTAYRRDEKPLRGQPPARGESQAPQEEAMEGPEDAATPETSMTAARSAPGARP